MIVRGKKVPWSDKEVIKELLEREIEVEISPNEWVKRENVRFQA